MECYILKFELNVEVWNPIVEVHSITPNEVIIKSCTTVNFRFKEVFGNSKNLP